jgi:hypothetical protein
MTAVVAAYDVVLDYGFGCGNRNWRIKNYQNEESNSYIFGYRSDCATQWGSTYHGRQNYVKLHVAIDNSNHPQWYIAWEAGIQGIDPWGTSDTSTGAGYHDTRFPASSWNSYNLHVQWIWTNDARPATSSNIHAHYLTDLWFVNPSSNPKRAVAIDFLWTCLKNVNGVWVQQTDFTDWYCKFTPYCGLVNGFDTYHYAVVLPAAGNKQGSAQWNDAKVNVGLYIAMAFGATYGNDPSSSKCKSSSPGSIGGYSIYDLESGIELQIGSSGQTGRIEGGFSMSELFD